MNIERDMTKLSRKDIEYINEEVVKIDPERRTVQITTKTLQGDYLVISLGADLNPEGIPGFSEACYNLYETQGIANLRTALDQFNGGKIVLLISRTPYRCPAAPYETAFLIEWLIRKKSIRDRTEICIYTPEKHPLPVAGLEVGKTLWQMLTDRNIQYYPEQKVTCIDKERKKIFFEKTETSYDLLIGIPPHKAPSVVVDAGLTDNTGYIPVHPQTMQILADIDTLETRFPGVYAIGDVTSIRLLNSMFLPKAGVFVEAQAVAVAGNIISQIKGEEPKNYFDGRGVCYVEVGDGLAATGSGNFYVYPAPWVTVEAPSTEGKKAKEELERVLEAWFEK